MIRPLARVIAAAAGASVMVSVLAGAAGAASRSAQARAPGAEVWARPYGGSGQLDNAAATSVAVSPSGHTVFVTGVTGSGNAGRSAEDYGTVAYNAATGTQLWARRYNGPASSQDYASSLAVSRAGGMVFVTAASDSATTPLQRRLRGQLGGSERPGRIRHRPERRDWHKLRLRHRRLQGHRWRAAVGAAVQHPGERS
jgi:DNA-binding beta-propeller fold protein YncE